MKRKRINPNRIPVGPGDYDFEQIKEQATSGMVLQEWAVILAALSNLQDMTTEKLLDFWQRMDRAPTQIHSFEDTERELVEIRELSGVSLSIQRISPVIHTQGDLSRFIRTVSANAVATAFAIIVEPMIREHILPSEELCIVLRRAAAMNEEIADGELSVRDIQQMLLEEYGLRLANDSSRCSLAVAEV